jgi:hypothetical protein
MTAQIATRKTRRLRRRFLAANLLLTVHCSSLPDIAARVCRTKYD